MGYKTEMDADWVEAQQAATVHAVRDSMTAAYADLKRYQADIVAEIAKGQFNTVHADIKTEGLAVKAIIDTAVTALDGHKDFLNWKQPKA